MARRQRFVGEDVRERLGPGDAQRQQVAGVGEAAPAHVRGDRPWHRQALDVQLAGQRELAPRPRVGQPEPEI